MFEQLLTHYQEGDLLLTANQRLATYLHASYDRLQTKQQQTVWTSPTIYAFNTWLAQLYQQGLDAGHIHHYLLNNSQCLALWEQIILASPAADYLLQPHGTAQRALKAWQLLQQWQIPTQQLADFHVPDCDMFLQWSSAYIAECQNKQWLDSSMLSQLLYPLIEQGHYEIGNRITLIGFTEIPPQLQQLLTVLKQKHIQVEFFQAEYAGECQQTSLLSTEQEIYAMAQWAKTQSADCERIGCVVPNLADIRPSIERIFATTFQAEGSNAEQQPYNISGGSALSDQSLIHCALTVLSLNQPSLALSQISALLLSPHLGASELEYAARARLDAQLRSLNQTAFSFKQLLYILSNNTTTTNKQECRYLTHALYELQKLLPKAELKQKPSAWVALFQQQWRCLGWPGDRGLNSTEYQIVERWQRLLLEAVQLDLIYPDIDFAAMLKIMENLARETLFQIRTEDTPIQVLGLLEATGMPFDKLWIMGLHDAQWPPAPEPNPFIPLSLQKQLKLPHASAEREYEFSQLLMDTFIKHCKQNIIFSYPQREADTSLQGSPLITHYPHVDATELASLAPKYREKPEYALLEYLNDEFGPEIIEKNAVNGGSFLFKLQAACPFRAFAELRLNASALDYPSPGIDPMTKGSLVHRCCELLWQSLQSHAQLQAANEATLQDLISKIISQAINELFPHEQQPLRLLQLETQRLQQLLLNWLEQEKQRHPFTVIATEQTLETRFADLQINLRVDRIDELDDGRWLIIDYKTGSSTPLDWFSHRPNEPQLPLYCVIHSSSQEQPIAGLLFAQMRQDDLRFKGITEEADLVNQVNSFSKLNNADKAETWSQQIAEWNDCLHSLAQEFSHGYAAVAPKNPVTTCAHCDLHTLCRINATDVSSIEHEAVAEE